MTPAEHNKTLSTLYFIYGAMHGLTLVGLVLLVLVVKLANPSALLMPASVMVFAVAAFVGLFLAVGLLPIVAGFGFRYRRRFVKPLAITLAVLSLINIPIGTALGIYTLKFFRSEGGVELYGGAGGTGEREIHDASTGAQPLMGFAPRLK